MSQNNACWLLLLLVVWVFVVISGHVIQLNKCVRFFSFHFILFHFFLWFRGDELTHLTYPALKRNRTQDNPEVNWLNYLIANICTYTMYCTVYLLRSIFWFIRSHAPSDCQRIASAPASVRPSQQQYIDSTAWQTELAVRQKAVTLF